MHTYYLKYYLVENKKIHLLVGKYAQILLLTNFYIFFFVYAGEA